MTVYEADPLRDPRWNDFLAHAQGASIFHTPEWLRALEESYGYTPVVYTTSAPGQAMENGVVFCRVNSVLTGRRLVSLPFSDHCEPLVRSEEELSAILSHVTRQAAGENIRYIEVRPLQERREMATGFAPHKTYQFHVVDLRKGPDRLFRGLHKNSFQRKVQRAAREGLTCQSGTSATLIEQFYELFVMTRRRHGLPPPPIAWIHSLVRHLGNAVQIRVVFRGELAVAGMLTLVHNDTIVYKYGGSDLRYAHLGGMPLAFWTMMREASTQGLSWLDLGRCESDNPGLIRYKDRLGSIRFPMTYWRAPESSGHLPESLPYSEVARRICSAAPDAVRVLAGRILYRHFG
ncbi:MAG: GNAT family N-acetyltransferase [Paludibaculum sp.]